MKNILIHGLGQNSKDWDTIKMSWKRGEFPLSLLIYLTLQRQEIRLSHSISGIQRAVRVLPRQTKSLRAFPRRSACAQLCYPVSEKINSLVLIGTPFEIPKGLLKFQNIVFRFMPKAVFQNMGVSKKILFV